MTWRGRGTAAARVAGVLVTLATVAGCLAGPEPGAALRVMVPNTAGSGYDVTGRTLVVSLREAGITDAEAFNLTGGSGTVALSRLLHERGNDRLVLLMGLGLVGSAQATPRAPGVGDAEPLARLVEEPEALIVPTDSPLVSVEALLAGWEAGDLTTGIGSHVGGPDHLAWREAARAAGLAPEAGPVARYDGGGALLGALLNGDVDAIMTGVSEYRHALAAGELRVLAVTGAERVPGLEAPTFRELGYAWEFVNWRGLLAPPGLTDSQREGLLDALDALHASEEWQTALRENGWRDAYLTGEPFARFLDEENERASRQAADDDRPGRTG
ncbi:putative tricarboxylic transport membrane protein [Streptomyces zhaozhouensis]|uniref:Putative tricarboxylic transport membrane protein n=1 Tax=Streptomyces zhaozhouensis TaxID=1300267 RepID=A0A286DRT1_9ACTN|nr:tripartite tricarboxylate transporter substrate-binding protein [Streptomyces zhaozhouensis]SOD61372.1 putative tricarboxylic transport membrane protein [Streptomyces zhaozhouensis]